MKNNIQATYDSKSTVENVVFDLVGSGVPHDKIEIDKENHQLNVSISGQDQPTIRKILERHNPEHITKSH